MDVDMWKMQNGGGKVKWYIASLKAVQQCFKS